jgi:hypothetical protein
MRNNTANFEYELERDEENFTPKTINIEIEISHDDESYEIESFKSDFELTGDEENEIQKYFDEHFHDFIPSEEEEYEDYLDSLY